MPQLPPHQQDLIRSVHENVRRLLRKAKTSQLVILIANESVATQSFGEIIGTLPDNLQGQEYQWLARAIQDELDIRVPIPASSPPGVSRNEPC